jgi:hypothetical protein
VHTLEALRSMTVLAKAPVCLLEHDPWRFPVLLDDVAIFTSHPHRGM